MGGVEQTLENADIKQVYESACAQVPAEVKVIAQNTQTLEVFDELFYAPVYVNDRFQMMGMLTQDLWHVLSVKQ